MNSLDILILILMIAVAIRGVATGFLRQVGSLGGFVLGLVAGAMLAPLVARAFPPSGVRVLVVLFIFFGTAISIGGIGESIGYSLSGLAEKYRLRALDAILGAALGITVALLGIWLMAATFARTGGQGLTTAIQNSRILQGLDRRLPPAPDVMARIERVLGVNGIPRVFTGLEPSPAPPVTGPNATAVNAAAAAGRPGTVKIEGLGCGGLLEGSGFAAGPGLVATNAHVVAGIDHPVVVDSAGSHAAQVVSFDPDLDFAVLRASGLAATSLAVNPDTVSRGAVGAALGYPGGGDFTVSPAAVLERQTALGRNIYDAGLIHRDIYALQAVVRPGNSGGPLVAPDGTVFGVIFAMSTTSDNVGYALTSAEVLPELRAASTSGPVSSGPCTGE